MEGYAVDGLAASGEPAGLAAGRGLAELEAAGNAVVPGLGPLVVRVAVMCLICSEHSGQRIYG